MASNRSVPATISGDSPPELFVADGKKTIAVMHEGRWVEKIVDSAEQEETMDELASLVDEDDIGILSPDWYEGRGKFMKPLWLNIDTRYSGRIRMRGWLPVDPKHYKDIRYRVRNLPEWGGNVITYQDCVLCEMPIDRAEKLLEIEQTKRILARAERLYGLDVDQTSGKYGDYASMIVKANEHGPEKDFVNSLPWDSPLARTLRSLEGRVKAMREEAAISNRLRDA